MGSFPPSLHLLCSRAASPAARPSSAKQSEKTSCNWQSISPFPLYSHPWQINHNQMLAQRGAPYAAGKKNEASRWSDSRIFQLTPLDWGKGHCGLPVHTSHKQTAPCSSKFGWSEQGFLGSARDLANLCCRDERRVSSCWGRGSGQWHMRLPMGTLERDAVSDLLEIGWGPLQAPNEGVCLSMLAACLWSVIYLLGREVSSPFHSLQFTYQAIFSSTFNHETENTFKNVLHLSPQSL